MEPQLNMMAIGVASLIPMIMGFIYYHPKVMGNAWMNANGFSQESLGNGPKPIWYLVALVLSFLFAVKFAVEVTGPGQDVAPDGHSYVTFQHGMAHGIVNTIMIILPIFGTLSIFEKRSWTWAFINVGYWGLCLIIMQGILSAWR
ncbi:MAG: DUF1761 domain-containing protein [Saprospiraceae bacterium]|jgi:hypothetical protein|nr:DUF1761 domain-containing protein [Saprospiraceae bacterium]MBK8296633.1 DUF1761 domain-containing protein [Saprospiraceae bacterium]